MSKKIGVTIRQEDHLVEMVVQNLTFLKLVFVTCTLEMPSSLSFRVYAHDQCNFAKSNIHGIHDLRSRNR